MPSGHPYVRHLAHPEVRGVERLPDPPVPGAAPGQWWPHPALTPEWVRADAGEFDLLHVHFGFEHRTLAQLSELVDTLEVLGKPLVLTVHDLESPHAVDPALHEAQLGVLLAAADAVITLTPGAAAEIDRTWGRRAVVVPHPHLAPPELIARPRPPREGFAVGVHLKSLRSGAPALPVVRGLTRAVAPLDGARLRVTIHGEVLDPSFPRADAVLVAWLQDAAADGVLDLDVVDRYDDAELFTYLRSLDLSVLPYGSGTHSGWLELCHDLGTGVLAPAFGYWQEQQPCLTYPATAAGPDENGLVSAVAHAYVRREEPWPRPTPENRMRQRAAGARAHKDVYAAVLARSPA